MKIQIADRGGAPMICGRNETIRVFFRCKTCKKSFAIEIESAVETVSRDGRKEQVIELNDDFGCPFCGSGNWKILGRVEKRFQFLVRHEVPCDSRCTNAPGPNCECSCCGEHHGSGRVIQIYECKRQVMDCVKA